MFCASIATQKDFKVETYVLKVISTLDDLIYFVLEEKLAYQMTSDKSLYSQTLL